MREFLMMTSTHRLFSLYVYDRINNDPIKFIMRELCNGQQRRLFIPSIVVDFQNTDQFFAAFLQPIADETKKETWFGLFSTVDGDCSLRYVINKIPGQIQSWNYDRQNRNYPINDQLEIQAESEDLQSKIGIFSFLSFYTTLDNDLQISYFYSYFYSNSSQVANSTQNQ